MNVNVLRLDHRLKRDTRITTHVCLTARAFGASKIYLAGERDNKLMENVRYTASRFGGNFEIEYAEGYMVVINKWKVPGKVYKAADWNVSVTTQPHSEVSSLAVFQHLLMDGKEFDLEFENPVLEVIPTAHGKNVNIHNENR